MKKPLAILLVLFTLVLPVKAQTISHHHFKMDISVGSNPITTPVAFGLTIEPHYRFSEAFALGLRNQIAASGDFKSEGSSNFRYYQTNCITGDYYVLQQKKANGPQVFIGGGVGVFNESYRSDPDQDNFGFFPRVGVESRYFRTSVEYNVTGGVRNYFLLNIGVVIGGGNK